MIIFSFHSFSHLCRLFSNWSRNSFVIFTWTFEPTIVLCILFDANNHRLAQLVLTVNPWEARQIRQITTDENQSSPFRTACRHKASFVYGMRAGKRKVRNRTQLNQTAFWIYIMHQEIASTIDDIEWVEDESHVYHNSTLEQLTEHLYR